MAKRPAKQKLKGRSAGRGRPPIHCVIFDLDDTLYDCLGQRVRATHRAAAIAMVRAGLNATVDQVYRARMRAFRQDPMLRHIDAEVCRIFKADHNAARISRLAHDAYFHHPVGKLTLFRGARALLRHLHSRGVRNFIVSFGEPKIQRAKVRALGLHNEPAVEKIFYADRDKLLTKEKAFRMVQRKLGLKAEQILVVGDRPMREIRAGNELGMYTVRLFHGEFAAQVPRHRLEKPDYVIRNIAEVRRLPFDFSAHN